MLATLTIKIGRLFFRRDELALAYSRMSGSPVLLSGRPLIAYWLMQFVSIFYSISKLRRIFDNSDWITIGYDSKTLNYETHSVFDLPEIVVSSKRPKTLNVLVPAFSIETISAGFFGVFAYAIFAARCGLHVRLVMFENFAYDAEKFRSSLKNYPGISDLYEMVEIVYIGHRAKPLHVSPQDLAVATVWYSAYLADAIRKKCSANHFIYLVQDYEAAFHPQNSSFVLADNTYKFPCRPWFSTAPLRDYFQQQKYPIGKEWVDHCVYQNACSPASDPAANIAKKKNDKSRSFVFYCRPAVHRNLFHLGSLAIIRAYREGAFDDGYNWSFHGMGIHNTEIYLDSTTKLVQLPRLSLADYQKKIGEFDLGLALMASAHPSLMPFDLAASGCMVVTNSFRTKTAEYFAGISSNILCADPDLDSLVEHIKLGVDGCHDLEKRLSGAKIDFPTTWDECWTEAHKKFLLTCVAEAFEEVGKTPVTGELP